MSYERDDKRLSVERESPVEFQEIKSFTGKNYDKANGSSILYSIFRGKRK